jgi:uroporphyrinogen decarboxylase
MTLMDEQLAMEIFNAVGSRLLQYYTRLLQFDCVGAVIGNDDWGFKTQTMLDTQSMRKYVIPWHRKIVEKVHACGKVAIMHSCGNLKEVMNDIIDDIGYDGKHSFEDGITPVEEAYKLWGSRIAIMGGIDVDFLCRSSEIEINKRARKLIETTFDQGGYCLGSGNSIPEFVPLNNYKAMLKAAWDMW